MIREPKGGRVRFEVFRSLFMVGNSETDYVGFFGIRTNNGVYIFYGIILF